MNIFKKALIVALSVGLISVPSVTKEVEAADSGEYRTVFLNVDEFTSYGGWGSSSAKFTVNYFGGTGITQQFTSFMDYIVPAYDETLKFYYAEVPVNAQNIIFVRHESSATSPSWINKWNQSQDISVSDTENYYIVTAWDKATAQNYIATPTNIVFNSDGGTEYEKKWLSNCNGTLDLSSYTPTKTNYSFKGWSDGKNTYTDSYTYSFSKTNNSVTLTALWEEVGSTECNVTYKVGSKTFTNKVPKGTSVTEGLPEEFGSSGYIVKSWDVTGTLETNSITVTAIEYVKTFDETKAELGFDYSYVNRAVVFQAPTTSKTAENKDTTYPVNFFYKTANGEEESIEVTSELKASDGWKNEFMLDLDTKYTQIRFEFKNEYDKDCKYPADGSYLNRDYNNNAIWWNKDDEFGSYPCSTYESAIDVKEVSNMSLRLGTGNVVLSSTDFGGVERYGVSITRGSVTKTQEWSSENAFVNNSLYLGLVLNNIDFDYWAEEFTVYCYAVYEDESIEKITVSDRKFSVKSLANTYATNGTTNGVIKVACAKIAA